jgi:hypothetical protein
MLRLGVAICVSGRDETVSNPINPGDCDDKAT